MEFKELLDALESMPTFAAGLSAEEQTELAGALRKAANGINTEAEPESSEPASEGDADDVQKGEAGEDLNASDHEPEAEPAKSDETEAEPEADDVQKSNEPAGDGFDRIMSAIEGLQTSIGKVSDDVRALDGRLSSVEKSVDVPLSGVVESTGTEPVGNPNATVVPWEMDLNTATDD